MTLDTIMDKLFVPNWREIIKQDNETANELTMHKFIIEKVLFICQQEIDEAKKRDSIILTTDQICQIAGFAGLNIDNPNLDEFEIEYTIDKSDKGLFVWTTEYPEEGSLNLESPKEKL